MNRSKNSNYDNRNFIKYVYKDNNIYDIYDCVIFDEVHYINEG